MASRLALKASSNNSCPLKGWRGPRRHATSVRCPGKGRGRLALPSSLSDFRRKSFGFNNGPFQPETVNTVIWSDLYFRFGVSPTGLLVRLVESLELILARAAPEIVVAGDPSPLRAISGHFSQVPVFQHPSSVRQTAISSSCLLGLNPHTS